MCNFLVFQNVFSSNVFYLFIQSLYAVVNNFNVTDENYDENGNLYHKTHIFID